ncbi:MAG: DUF4949 domain-containing protein [Legionella longbeachae]|nr:DUF4949 domain-containing protein [Legionella longbeachae]
MSLGLKLTTITTALLIAGSVFAEEPICPNLSDIQAVGINMASQLGYDLYVGYTVNDYNTSSTWTFGIGPVEADSDEDAIDISNDILADMSGPGVPTESDGQMLCVYETGDPNLFAVGIKDFEGMSPMKFKQYMHKAH